MREIKFKVWNKVGKSMDNSGLSIRGNKIIEQIGFKILQFTGLKDKKGKEIYEGDIVEIDWKDERYNKINEIVKWDEENARWDFGAGTSGEVNWSHKVIGNIYENPELLEDEKQ